MDWFGGVGTRCVGNLQGGLVWLCVVCLFARVLLSTALRGLQEGLIATPIAIPLGEALDRLPGRVHLKPARRTLGLFVAWTQCPERTFLAGGTDGMVAFLADTQFLAHLSIGGLSLRARSAVASEVVGVVRILRTGCLVHERFVTRVPWWTLFPEM